MIGLIDYGSGNLRSVHRALLKVGADVKLVKTAQEADSCDSLVLPGVGAFDDCLNALEKERLVSACRSFIEAGRPFLGICVGYQALFDRSQEFQSTAKGIGVFKGDVVKFPTQPGLKVPQIGWNQLHIVQSDCPLYRGVEEGSYVYFVHSYFPKPEDASIVATWTDYGVSFASSIAKGNTFATQFHPEKSQRVGLQILKNFVELKT